jgi:plasmid stability protein
VHAQVNGTPPRRREAACSTGSVLGSNFSTDWQHSRLRPFLFTRFAARVGSGRRKWAARIAQNRATSSVREQRGDLLETCSPLYPKSELLAICRRKKAVVSPKHRRSTQSTHSQFCTRSRTTTEHTAQNTMAAQRSDDLAFERFTTDQCRPHTAEVVDALRRCVPPKEVTPIDEALAAERLRALTAEERGWIYGLACRLEDDFITGVDDCLQQNPALVKVLQAQRPSSWWCVIV